MGKKDQTSTGVFDKTLKTGRYFSDTRMGFFDEEADPATYALYELDANAIAGSDVPVYGDLSWDVEDVATPEKPRYILVDTRATGLKTLTFNVRGQDSAGDLARLLLIQGGLRDFILKLRNPNIWLNLFEHAMASRNGMFRKGAKVMTDPMLLQTTRKALGLGQKASVTDEVIAHIFTSIQSKTFSCYNNMAVSEPLCTTVLFQNEIVRTNDILFEYTVEALADVIREAHAAAEVSPDEVYKTLQVTAVGLAAHFGHVNESLVSTLKLLETKLAELQFGMQLAAAYLYDPESLPVVARESVKLSSIASCFNIHLEADALYTQYRDPIAVRPPEYRYHAIIEELATVMLGDGRNIKSMQLDEFASHYSICITQNDARYENGMIIMRRDELNPLIRVNRIIDYNGHQDLRLQHPLLETRVQNCWKDSITALGSGDEFYTAPETAIRRLWSFDENFDPNHLFVGLLRVSRAELLALAATAALSVHYHKRKESYARVPVYIYPRTKASLRLQGITLLDETYNPFPEAVLFAAATSEKEFGIHHAAIWPKPHQQLEDRARDYIHLLNAKTTVLNGQFVKAELYNHALPLKTETQDGISEAIIRVDVSGLKVQDVTTIDVPLVDLLGDRYASDIYIDIDVHNHRVLNGMLATLFEVYNRLNGESRLQETARYQLIIPLFAFISEFAKTPTMQAIIRAYTLKLIHAQMNRDRQLVLRNRLVDAYLWMDIGSQIVCQVLQRLYIIDDDNFMNILQVLKDNSMLYDHFRSHEAWSSLARRGF